MTSQVRKCAQTMLFRWSIIALVISFAVYGIFYLAEGRNPAKGTAIYDDFHASAGSRIEFLTTPRFVDLVVGSLLVGVLAAIIVSHKEIWKWFDDRYDCDLYYSNTEAALAFGIFLGVAGSLAWLSWGGVMAALITPPIASFFILLVTTSPGYRTNDEFRRYVSVPRLKFSDFWGARLVALSALLCVLGVSTFMHGVGAGLIYTGVSAVTGLGVIELAAMLKSRPSRTVFGNLFNWMFSCGKHNQ